MVYYLKVGDTIHKKQHSLLNRAKEATNMLKEHIDKDETIRIISHNDADGISSAAVIANALNEEKIQYHITIIPRLTEEIISKLKKEQYPLFIFSDMGSAFVNKLNKFKKDVIIADHHQVDNVESDSNLVHINPHLFGIDGSKDLSGAGSSYLILRELDKKHLSYFALIGAFGDMQGQKGFTGINEMILQDGLNTGNLEITEGLKIVSKSSEPLFKSLAYTFTPPLPGITGNLEGSMAFLEKTGISYGIKFTDLAPEEKDALMERLIAINPDIFGNIYHVPKENPLLRNLEEYAYILDATGKNKKNGLGLSIAIGERKKALETAQNIQSIYRKNIVKGLEWIKKNGATELNTIQYLYSEDKLFKSIMGTIVSIALSIGIINPSKPVLGLSKFHNDIKISGRTTRELVDKGVDLGKALHDSSNNFGGQGGGHDIAAGAMISEVSKDLFLHLVDEMVEHQLNSN